MAASRAHPVPRCRPPDRTRRSSARPTGTPTDGSATGSAARSTEQPRSARRSSRLSTAFGPDIYCGSSGVALFLAQLAPTTRRQDAKEPRSGPCRNALRNAERLRPTASCRRCRSTAACSASPSPPTASPRLTGELADLAARADALLERVATGTATPHVFDVIGGQRRRDPGAPRAGAFAGPPGADRPGGRARRRTPRRRRRPAAEVLDVAADRTCGPGVSGRRS